MNPTAVINIVGLTSALIGESSPNITALIARGRLHRLRPVLPAVTCPVQSSMLTGLPPGGPQGHGVVGNGWYDRQLAEIHFWKQSNRLVGGEKVWETARRRDPSVTCCNMFWWFNMYSSADFSVTPRPIYRADGRKVPDFYTAPPDLHPLLRERLGPFPLFRFWGPASSIASSRWIAEAAMHVHELRRPTLTLVYLPHLDYDLQRLGPDDPAIRTQVAEIDAVAGRLIRHFERHETRIIVLSEYGIAAVTDSVHINRELRREGLLGVRDELGGELLDPGAGEAFAVADHQVAHVYVNRPRHRDRIDALLRRLDGVDRVLAGEERAACGLDHARAGDFVLLAAPDRWFSYDYWLTDDRAPDFARTVDIHRKPGYDPCELFLDPALRWPRLRIARRLAQKKLGLRALMDVVPLDTSLVRGSHGRVDQPPASQPVLVTTDDRPDRPEALSCLDVRDVILEHIFE